MNQNQKTSWLKNALIASWIWNMGMWITELIAGISAQSSSLILDSIDFISDGASYFSSIAILRKSEAMKTLVGKIKWGIMLAIGIAIGWWTLQKYLGWAIPDGNTMTTLGVIWLGVNLGSAYLLSKYQDESLDLKAVWLCTRNDAINSILIIVSGVVTNLYHSPIPDTILWIWMSGLAIYSGISILRWGSHEHSHSHSHKDGSH